VKEIFQKLVDLNIPDSVFLLLFLIIIFLLFLIARRYRVRPRPRKEFKPRIFEKRPEILKMEGEDTFKEIIINAVRKAGFVYQKELFKNTKEDIVFEVRGLKVEKYIIVGHYWPHDVRIYMPVEEVKKYFERIQSSGSPHIIATNSLGLKQKARDLMEKFNKKFEKPKLFFVSGSSEAQFIQKFKNIIGE